MGKQTKRSRIEKSHNWPGELVLTPGEQYLIWRRRNKWTQSSAAWELGVPLHAYKLIETDKMSATTGFTSPWTKKQALAAHERCLIYRKRCGKTQKEIAAEMGVSRFWFHKMESGAIDSTELMCWWEV